jgi:hypothetical protein
MTIVAVGMASGNKYKDLIVPALFILLTGSAIKSPITTNSGIQTSVKRIVFFTAS